ncbi:uncharacterized protein si:ch211-191i18.2 isoform X2 [Trichomycterus rosablanca]|uniref:uncharacterized protein si:ch211-191i18.2 isoform X2 n=1 Tax=Trichomycterus rosablanca TaxID=2290929 RepID=UPI002F360BF1
MPLCCDVIEVVSEYDSYYDSTAAPDYDYNSTFLYSFFSNGSSEDWDIFIREKESETETGELDIEPTVSNNNQAGKTTYPSLLLTVVLTVHHLFRIL